MECFVGTSGWVYDWNPDGLRWYVSNSGLNAVELNASFYRLPYENMVSSWRRVGARLRWSVKIHRRITHVHRLNEKALRFWRLFWERFKPLDDIVDFYLLQLPPSYTASAQNIEKLRRFAEEIGLGERLAVEYRHVSWWRERLGERVAREIGATVVSVDAPEPIGLWLWRSSRSVYLRMHGRTMWYAHEYSFSELAEIANLVSSLGGERVYVFFNNNHWMLENAKAMKRLLEESICAKTALGSKAH